MQQLQREKSRRISPALLKLQLILKEKKVVKAKELRKILRCTLPTVYRRIATLRKYGADIQEVIELGPARKTGPRPRRFVLVKEVPAKSDGSSRTSG